MSSGESIMSGYQWTENLLSCQLLVSGAFLCWAACLWCSAFHVLTYGQELSGNNYTHLHTGAIPGSGLLIVYYSGRIALTAVARTIVVQCRHYTIGVQFQLPVGQMFPFGRITGQSRNSISHSRGVRRTFCYRWLAENYIVLMSFVNPLRIPGWLGYFNYHTYWQPAFQEI